MRHGHKSLRMPQPELALETSPDSKMQIPGEYRFLEPAKTTVVFDSYWRFAAERQQVFFRRLDGFPPPWTNDPVLLQHKFTNAYRASDRVSQYLIRQVIYQEDMSAREVLFRTLLFKFFNRIATWERLQAALGVLETKTFRCERYARILDAAINSGERVYSAAYIMPSGGRGSQFARKHQMHLWLLDRMLKEDLPDRLSEANSMQDAFELLRSYPSIGDFLAYQFVTDLNYSPVLHFSEMEFVMPGPGARSGLRKCFSDFGGLSETELIQLVVQRQEDCIRAAGVDFRDLWGRRLQLIDCQNLFCETDKYARVAHPNIGGLSGRTRIKQRFSITGPLSPPWYPPKWGLNEKINPRSIHVFASPRTIC